MKSTKASLGSTDLWHARRVFGPKARASGRTSQVLAGAALSADHFDPKASKAALSALVALAQRHGDVRALDVEVVARKLAADAAESLRAMYDAVTELKQHGALSRPKQVETVSMADIDRLERGHYQPPWSSACAAPPASISFASAPIRSATRICAPNSPPTCAVSACQRRSSWRRRSPRI